MAMQMQKDVYLYFKDYTKAFVKNIFTVGTDRSLKNFWEGYWNNPEAILEAIRHYTMKITRE